MFVPRIEMPSRKLIPIRRIFLLDGGVDGIAQVPPRGGIQCFPVAPALDRRPQRRVGVGIVDAFARRLDDGLGATEGIVEVDLAPQRIQHHGTFGVGHRPPRPGGIRQCRQGIAACAVDPACAKVERQAGPEATGPDAAANAVSRLEHRHLRAAVGQCAGGTEASHACADDDHARP